MVKVYGNLGPVEEEMADFRPAIWDPCGTVMDCALSNDSSSPRILVSEDFCFLIPDANHGAG